MSNTTLSPKQIAAVEALLNGASITDAAEAAHVHRSTVHEWLRTHRVFRAALSQARHVHAERILDSLHDLTVAAVGTLQEALTSPDAPISVRLRAALAILKVNTNADPARASTSQRNFEDLAEAAFHYGADMVTTAIQQKATESDTFGEESATQQPVPRSAQCPCGSGRKYKRCCGHAAPPVLSSASAA